MDVDDVDNRAAGRRQPRRCGLREEQRCLEVGADQIRPRIFVDFADGSTLAQLGLPDMRTALAVGLGWPRRIASGVPALDLLAEVGRLEFEAPDLAAFPCLRLAFDALEAGGCAPAVLNAANEEAVSAFLQGRIGFLGIPDTVEATLDAMPPQPADSLDALLDEDARARAAARARMGA